MPKKKPVDPEASRRARRSRTSGRTFERTIVNWLKARYQDQPWAQELRRSDQTHRAWLSDVTGVPGLWIECQLATTPFPARKLQQAMRDVAEYAVAGKKAIPIAVTKRKHSASTEVTLCLGDLARLLRASCEKPLFERPVTLALEAFFDLWDCASYGSDSAVLDTGEIAKKLKGEHVSALKKRGVTAQDLVVEERKPRRAPRLEAPL